MDEEKKWTIEEEKEALINALKDMAVEDESYRQTTAQIEALTRIQKLEVEADVTNRKMEREANLAESKAKAELRIREDEAAVKKKDSRRGVLKVILAGLFGVGQIVLVNHYEELKPQIGKAWNFIFKPKI